MGKQKTLIFSSILPCLFTFFLISAAENKVLGVVVINTSDTQELEELPSC